MGTTEGRAAPWRCASCPNDCTRVAECVEETTGLVFPAQPVLCQYAGCRRPWTREVKRSGRMVIHLDYFCDEHPDA